MTPLLALGPEPLALEPLVNAVAERPESATGSDGAIATFLGVVRNHNVGRRVRSLEYEAYEPLARKAFERIAAEVAGRWPGVRLALHHRVGRLEIRTSTGTFNVEGDRIRRALMLDVAKGRILPSTMFDLEKRMSGGVIASVDIVGGGNGHGVGMCQNGAIGMARRGYAYDMILQHYYPGSELRTGY